jgi:hypothetical protein
MRTLDFLSALSNLSKQETGIKLYPYKDSGKLYSRFWAKMFWLKNPDILTKGFLREIFKETNGIDLDGFYIVPFNNYFNKKNFSFDDFCREWIIDQNNPDEILADFYSFMTDGKTLVGYLDHLKDSQGNNFIGIAQGDGMITDITVISSNIFMLFDEIIKQLKSSGKLHFPKDINYWRSIDSELNLYYENSNILKYKMAYLFDADSVNFEKCHEEIICENQKNHSSDNF